MVWGSLELVQVKEPRSGYKVWGRESNSAFGIMMTEEGIEVMYYVLLRSKAWTYCMPIFPMRFRMRERVCLHATSTMNVVQ
jgi:hypothetical protein